MLLLKWSIVLSLLLPLPALAAPSTPPTAQACEYGRGIVSELTAAILGDAERAARHRHNPLSVVKRAERRFQQSEGMQILLARCGSHGLSGRELRWMAFVVERALENAVVGQNAPSGARLLHLLRLLDEAIFS